MHTWFPFRQHFHYTNCFFITAMANSSKQLDITDASVFLDNETHKNTPLNTFFFCLLRIFNIL